jgi:hypothetical protein
MINSLSYSYGDDEEFTGVAEPNSSPYPSETVYPRAPSQRISYVLSKDFISIQNLFLFAAKH